VPVGTGNFTGHFHVALSTRRVLVATFYVGLAFLLLGIAAYYCFRRLPLVALDDALQKLQSQNLRFDMALNNMSQGLCMFDGEHRLVVCNARYAQMYGLPAELTATGTPFSAILEERLSKAPEDSPYPENYARDLAVLIDDNRIASKVVELQDGRVLVVRYQPMPGGGWIAMHEDVTEQRRIEARVAYLANHDTLTDLPNRPHLRARLSQELDEARSDSTVAVLSLDLDRFKDINEARGHTRGDEVLKEIAERLRGCVSGSDLVARLDGDKFAILQIGAEQPISPPRWPRASLRQSAPRSTAAAIRSLSARASASPFRRRTAAQPMSFCRTPIWPGSWPRTRSGAPTGSSSQQRMPTCRRGGDCSSICTRRSATASSCSTTSRSSTSSAMRSAAWRPYCAGSIPSAAASPQRSSCR
jgi:GGDEF domain-containing protein/PAS domain-containing protein